MLDKFLQPAGVKWYETGIMALLAVVILLQQSIVTELHGDESQWIFSSASFEALLSLDLDSAVWQEQYWTLTQPPVTRYLIGAGRLLGGYGPSELNLPWIFGQTPEWNEASGRIPHDGLLFFSRLPMVFIGGLALGMVYAGIAGMHSRLAGLLAAILLAGNSLVVACLTRAMAEAPLLFSVILAWIVGGYSAERVKGSSSAFLYGVLGGLVCGLAASIKLNGFGLTGVAGSAVCFGILRNGKTFTGRAMCLSVYGVTLAVTTCAVFVLLNPFLYSDPYTRTQAMFANRVQEMQQQYELAPRDRLTTKSDSIKEISQNTLTKYATAELPAMNLILSLVGLIAVANFTLRRTDRVSMYAASFLASLVFAAGPWLFSPLNWDRYHFMPVCLSTILIAVGVAETLRQFARRFRQ